MCDLLKFGTPRSRCSPAAPCSVSPLFRIGRSFVTPVALALLQRHGVDAGWLLMRHASGDFGEVNADSVRDNLLALVDGSRVLSSYRLLDELTLARMTPEEKRRSPTVWCITECDRFSTTLLIGSAPSAALLLVSPDRCDARRPLPTQ
jgi:hypothetical protein